MTWLEVGFIFLNTFYISFIRSYQTNHLEKKRKKETPEIIEGNNPN